MSTTPDERTGRRDWSVPAAVVTLTVVSLVGSLVAVGTDLNSSWWDAVGPTGRLSVPLPFNALLLLLAAAAASGTRPRLATAAAWLLVVATVVAVLSGVFDGGYAAELTALQRVCQVALVLCLLGTAYVAGRRATGLARQR
jgi:hypothetical protein